MILQEVNGVKFLQFENFINTGIVNHCLSTRVGGVSEGVYESLNLGYNRGDKKENVDKNFELLLSSADFNSRDVVFSHQVHKTNVFHVKSVDDNFKIKEIDALVTDKKGLILGIFNADCTPILFLDKRKKIIGGAHAGWRGTIDEIAKVTLEEMVNVYHSDLKDILVGIGPSIGNCCFEVDFDVADEFLSKDFAKDYVTYKKEVNKYYIDLWMVNKNLLITCGVPPENIEITSHCTKCNPDLFYSHRICGKERGTMMSFMEIK